MAENRLHCAYAYEYTRLRLRLLFSSAHTKSNYFVSTM